MSWLNFNEGLNSLKGQITNFAQTVLNEEEDAEQMEKSTQHEELKKICLEQKQEIARLGKENEDLRKRNNPDHEGWSWVNNDETTNADNSSFDATEHLKREIDRLQNENKDLIGQLEQLDSDNQQNVSKLVEVRNSLQTELQNAIEERHHFEQLYLNSVAKEQSCRDEINTCRSFHEETLVNQRNSEDELNKKYQNLLVDFEKLTSDFLKTKKELDVFNNNEQNISKIVLEKEGIQKELEKVKVSFSKLEELLEASVARENQLQDDVNSLQKQHKEEIEDYKKRVDEFEARYQCLLKKCEPTNHLTNQELPVPSKKFDSERSIVKNEFQSCEELTDCDLQATNVDNNLFPNTINSYFILTALFDSYNKGVSDLIKIFKSFKLHFEIEERQSVENDLIHLKTQMKSFKEQTDLIHSKYLNNEIFRNQLDAVVELSTNDYAERMISLEKTLDCPVESEKEELVPNSEQKLKHHKALDMKTYIKMIRKAFDNLKHSEGSSEYPEHSVGKDYQELNELLKEIYNYAFELRSKVILLSDSNINIITEKNQEIERLLEASDQMNQDIIEKAQTIKEYENEIAELSKNNDLLIAELEVYKSNHLETISEIDEDKTVLLEEQLDKANIEIKELQSQLETFEVGKNIQAQLEIIDTNLEEEDNTHLELLNKYDELQVEYDMLRKDYSNIEQECQAIAQENLSLKSMVDSLKANSENLLYLQDELKTSNESLLTDIEIYKGKINELIETNNKMKVTNEQNESLKNEISNVEAKIIAMEKIKDVSEKQVLELTEKLKNAKMSETSLKMQHDTLNKEKINELIETNNKLTAAYKENEYLKNEISNAEEKIISMEKTKDVLENEVFELNEKLKTVTLSETCLKIQHDTLNEEYSNLTDNVTKMGENVNNLQIMLTTCQNECRELKIKNEELSVENKTLEEFVKIRGENKNELEDVEQIHSENSTESTKSQQDGNENTTDYDQLVVKLHEFEQENADLKQELENVKASQAEIIQLVTTKHQENVAYHSEIQRLNQILSNESQKCRDFEIQVNTLKTAIANNSQEEETNSDKFKEEIMNLKEQCDLLSQSLLEEQAKVAKFLDEKSQPSEAETSLKKKLERLQAHLIEIEEHYTSELFEAEQTKLALQARVNEIEEREKNSSTMYTSVSIRANQQVESLQNQLQTITGERDSLRKQISDLEDTINKQTAALTNLQLVLEQFRKDKEKEVLKETERLRRQINTEKKTQGSLKDEILSLKSQLEESKQGLLAAARLSDQLENSKSNIAALKEEVSQLQNHLTSKQEELNAALSQTDGKVDKSLIKNLIIGFVISNNNLNKDQTQILKIIGTVLDFNQLEYDKLNLNKGVQGSWLSGFLSPQNNPPNVGQESLSKAFVEFLEKESKPRVLPSLLNANSDTPKPNSSRSSTPSQSLANLNEIVLPTFADFAQNRNSSSILKDVLKDNS